MKIARGCHHYEDGVGGVSMGVIYNATFNNISIISWRSVLLVEKTGVSEENH
jgi:hypothetical protein